MLLEKNRKEIQEKKINLKFIYDFIAKGADINTIQLKNFFVQFMILFNDEQIKLLNFIINKNIQNNQFNFE